MDNISNKKQIISDTKTALNRFQFYEKFYLSINGKAKSYLKSQSRRYKQVLRGIQEIILPHVRKICPTCSIQCCKIYNQETKRMLPGAGAFKCADYLLARCDTPLPDPCYVNAEKNLCLFFNDGCTLPIDARSLVCIGFFCDTLRNELDMKPIDNYLQQARRILMNFSIRECLF